MNKTSLVIVVLEDDAHEMIVYRYLRQCGLGAHQIRVSRSQSGRGSAEHWVRASFVRETSIYRARQAKTALIVMIDADINTVQDRLIQLDQALKDNGKPALDRSERIARLIPKRNIETWILNLNGGSVNEETDYKKSVLDWNASIRTAAEALHKLARSRSEPTGDHVNSLRRGIDELKRLDLWLSCGASARITMGRHVPQAVLPWLSRPCVLPAGG